MGFGIKIGGTTQITRVAKPVLLTSSYSFNTQEQTANISGYIPELMTRTGVYKATASGSYSVTFTLNKHCKWADGTKTPVTIVWEISKIKLKKPSLTNTSFTWMDGQTHAPTINDMNDTYINQSGTTSVNDSSTNIGGANYSISWSLKYPDSTTWQDETTKSVSETWSVSFVRGTSHYQNDIFNFGWHLGDQSLVNSTLQNSTAGIDSNGRIVIDGAKTMRDSNYNYYAFAHYYNLNLNQGTVCIQVDEYSIRTSSSYPDKGSSTYRCGFEVEYRDNSGVQRSITQWFRGIGVHKIMFDRTSTFTGVFISNYGDYYGDYYVANGVLFRISRIWVE